MTRVALVGPMPPTRSGIADYNLRVVEALRRLCDVVVFDPTRPLARHLRHATPVPVLPTAALGVIEPADEFDAIVYTFGNNDHHHASYDLLKRHPGWVWVHDVRMTGMHLSYSWRLPPAQREDHVRALLERQYGVPLPERIGSPHVWTVEGFDEADVYMSHPLVARSCGTLLNSSFARELMLRDLGSAPVTVPVGTVPFAVPTVARVQDPSPRPTVVVPGFVTTTKLPALVIEAFKRSTAKAGGELVFLGEAPAEVHEIVDATAAAHGVRDQVRCTGYLERAEYAAWLDRAHAAVLVRATTQGESSAAATDCLVRGLPTVTNVPSTSDFATPLLRRLDGVPSHLALSAELDRALASGIDVEEGARIQDAYSFDRAARALAGVLGIPH